MEETEEPKQRGAPSKYKPEYATIARQLCLLEGSTDRELAEAFEVSEKTIDNWKKQYPEFLRSVQEGKKLADAKVAEAFFKRCVGFDYHEITREGKAPFDPDSGRFDKSLLKVTKVVTKHVPPDAGAALNWLKNRQPDKWRDKVEHHHSGKIETNDLSQLSDQQLDQLQVDLEKKLNHGNING